MIKYLENIMCKISKYEEFCNEKINIKKTLSGIALGAGLAFGNPSVGNTQIKTTKIVNNTKDNVEIKYDSLSFYPNNFTDLKKIIGQTLYMKPKKEMVKIYLDNEFSGSGFFTFKNDNLFRIKSDSLLGEYLKVVDCVADNGISINGSNVVKDLKIVNDNGINKWNFSQDLTDIYSIGKNKLYTYQKSEPIGWLKLENKNGDFYYFRCLGSTDIELHFIIVGEFEKTKSNIGKYFLMKKTSMSFSPDKVKNLKTGEKIVTDKTTKWKCIDVIVLDSSYEINFVLKNETDTILVPDVDFINCRNYPLDPHGFIIDYNLYKSYITKYGKYYADLIVNGEVVVGMSKKMCILSWGEPKDINKASYGDQWVYSNTYLYFDNSGKLTSWN
jgi:uncharacterized protein (DUF433 family)